MASSAAHCSYGFLGAVITRLQAELEGNLLLV